MQTAIEVFRATENNGPLDRLILQLKSQPTGSKPPLPKRLVDILLYFRKIELLVMVQYIQEIQKMPSYWDSDIREFGIAWTREETRHGVAIEECLRIRGYICEPLTKQDVTWKYIMFTWLIVVGSWVFWRVSPIVHMFSGLLNETIAKSGYWAFMKHTSDSELRKMISLIQYEEMRHHKFYQDKGLELMDSDRKRRWASKLIRFIWQPVGAGNADIKALADVLLKKEDIAKGFFHHVETMTEKIKTPLPEICDLIMSDLRTLARNQFVCKTI